MDNSLSVDFDDFTATRLDAAEQKLNTDDEYLFECELSKQNVQKLQKTFNPEQTECFDAVELSRNSIAGTRERNAYLSGLADGLRIMSTL